MKLSNLSGLIVYIFRRQREDWRIAVIFRGEEKFI
jgi:hypothetical protein